MARPRSFEPEEVLDRAMRLFWRQGFETTSIQELEAAMGINRFSIYNTFGDKQGLYLAALDRYRDEVASDLLHGLERGSAGLAALRDFFEGFRGRAPEAMGVGCFMVNCAVEHALDDPKAARRIQAHAARMQAAMAAALGRARASGELRTDLCADARIDELASYLTVAVHGILVGVRMRQPLATLASAIAVILREIDGWGGAS